MARGGCWRWSFLLSLRCKGDWFECVVETGGCQVMAGVRFGVLTGRGWGMADLSFKVRADGTSELDKVRAKYEGVRKDMAQGITVGVGVKVADMAMKGLGKVAGTIKSGLQTAIEQENFQVAFEQFTGSVENAVELMKRLNELSVRTPFTGGEVMGAANSLLSAGMEWEKAFGTVESLTNMAKDGQQLQELTAILGKGFAKGKFQTEQVNQFVERGINLYPALAKSMGVAEDELGKLITKGLTFNQVMGGLETMSQEGGQFYKYADKKSQTTEGLMSTIGGGVEQANKELFTPLLESAKPMLKLLADNMKTVVSITEVLGKGLARLAPILAPFVAIWGAGKLVGQIKGVVGMIGMMGGKVNVASSAVKVLNVETKMADRIFAELGMTGAKAGVQIEVGMSKAARAMNFMTKQRGGRLGGLMGGGAMLGASVVGGLVADVFNDQTAESEKAIKMMEGVTNEIKGLNKYTKAGTLFGDSSEQETALTEIDEKIRAAYDGLNEAEKLNVGYRGTSKDVANGAIASYRSLIGQLKMARERIKGVTAAEMEAVRASREWTVAQKEAELANAEKAKELKNAIKEYTEAETRMKETEAMGGNGAAALAFLRQKRERLLGSYGSRGDMVLDATNLSYMGGEAAKAKAVDLFKTSSQVAAVEHQIAEIERKREETLEKIKLDMMENVEAAELEVRGKRDEAEALRRKAQILKQTAELERAGLQTAEARAKAEEMVLRAASLREDQEAKANTERLEGEARERRERMQEDLTDRARAKAADEMQNPYGGQALELVRRMDQLKNEYGMGDADARKQTFGELSKNWAGSPVTVASSMRAIGGGGSAVALTSETRKQTILLERAVTQLEQINSGGIGTL